MMSMSYDEMVEGFAAGQGAMLYQANWTHPSIQADTAATNGKVKCVAFPVIEGGAGSITEFSGGSLMDIISIQTVSIQRKLWNTWNT